jgi:hypothetical protein
MTARHISPASLSEIEDAALASTKTEAAESAETPR